MKRQFYIHYYKDFANTFDLYWIDCPEMIDNLPEDAKRITYKRAVELCRKERFAQSYNNAFSGFATSVIYPAIRPNYYPNHGYAAPKRYIVPLKDESGNNLRPLVTCADKAVVERLAYYDRGY